MHKQIGPLLLALLLLLLCAPPALAAPDETRLDAAVEDMAAYILQTVAQPQPGSVGGEWAVLGLARSSYPVPDAYYQNYYNTLEKYVAEQKGELHSFKYTEYSRLILALTALGRDPQNVAGYDLLKPLGDFEKTLQQGLNGPVWALIALDAGAYEIPVNAEASTQATRDLYLAEILSRQLPDGGFTLLAAGANPSAEPDITGMALQALAPYQNRPAVKTATDKALACLSALQQADGGFLTDGAATCESTVHVLIALCELGIAVDDVRFVKNGQNVLDNLLSYYTPGQGFSHLAAGGTNLMASEQGLFALVAVQRLRQGQSSLYRMQDTAPAVDDSAGGQTAGAGLSGKHADVTARPVVEAGKTFADITGHANQTAIEALAARGIITGQSETSFAPDATMTRAEFAAIVVRGLGLTPQAREQFTDVAADAWYAPYIGTAYAYGIITGVSATSFAPGGTITREAAATMVARAAKLCGLDTAMNAMAVRDTLAQFTDYLTSSTWARESLAFCYYQGILDDAALEIEPQTAIKRCEIAQMLYQLLDLANLL